MRNAEYEDPRLVEIYDAEGPWSRDDDYFAALIGETPGARVLDVGCGTGRLALGLAAAGHIVTGIDPSEAALDAARAKDRDNRVTWIRGTAADVPAGRFDVAIMTGHVAQFLTTEREWTDTLRVLWGAIVAGGRLAFHAYDPASRVWDTWNRERSRRHLVLDGGATVSIWTEVTAAGDELVSYSRHYQFSDGRALRSDSTLRFWSESQWRQSVLDAGFAIERVHGGWNGEPVGAGDGELIFVTCRRAASGP